MKTNKKSYPKIGKTVSIDFTVFKDKTVIGLAFQDRAIRGGWTVDEFDRVKDFLIGKSFEEQLEILAHYAVPPIENVETILQEDIAFMLAYLGMVMHYLGSKSIDLWDAYDWSNYHRLKQKATSRIVRKYAYYSDAVEEKHKYLVDSPPTLFFDTKEEAEKLLPENELETTNIYPLWVHE